MKIAILQPAYLPWLGFFDLMEQVDTFVLLDNVQFEKRSWQQRNRIKTPTGLQLLTVPVKSRGRFDQRISDVEISESEFWRDHVRSIEVNYRRAPFFAKYFDECVTVLSRTESGLLLDLTASLIDWIAAKLGLTTPVVRASALQQGGVRTELLKNLCVRLGAREYLSPIGSADYLIGEEHLMTSSNVAVYFHHYVHPEYSQQFPPFVPYASAIDLLFNEGPRSREILRRGTRAALRSVQVAAHLMR